MHGFQKIDCVVVSGQLIGNVIVNADGSQTPEDKHTNFERRSPDLDGASAYFDGVPFAFVSARFPPRMLFTLAHECGHLIAHHDPSVSFAVIDQSTAAEGDPAVNTAEERFANTFA